MKNTVNSYIYFTLCDGAIRSGKLTTTKRIAKYKVAETAAIEVLNKYGIKCDIEDIDDAMKVSSNTWYITVNFKDEFMISNTRVIAVTLNVAR